MAESGIYEIVNLVNGKRYVGSTVSFRKRWAEHQRGLRRGAHHSRALLRAWQKYGEDSFAFRVLEECPADRMVAREQDAFDRLQPEYNICKSAGSSLGVRPSDDVRQKMSAAQRRRYSSLSDGERRSQAAHLCDPEMQRRAATARIGVKYSPRSAEHRRKISEAKRGKPNYRQRGKIVSEATRQKIREARAKQVFPPDCRKHLAKLTDDQVREIRRRRAAGEFCSQIGADFGLGASAVSRICLRQRYDWVDQGEPPISFPKKGRGGWKHKPDAKTGRVRRANTA
jgi:hypothetical protein